MDHEFRSSLGIFDGVREDGHLPPRVNAINIITMLTFDLNGLRVVGSLQR